MKCPNCGKEVSPEFNVCPWCGYKPKKCSKPEHQDVWLPDDARFCPRCGESLEGDNTQENVRAKSRTVINDDYPDENIEFYVDGVCFEMVYVEGGTFMMGAQSDDEDEENYDPDACKDEGPVHEVTLSDYYIGKTPVTQELWKVVMGDNPSVYNLWEDCPVEMVSWEDCQAFIKKLNNKLRNQLSKGYIFRLPTEAQWEFAARGGNESDGYMYSGSDDIDEVAWYEDNSNGEPGSMFMKEANELGIYDMSGNVEEWCQDWYDDYVGKKQVDPTGPKTGMKHVLRGGAWNLSADYCRLTSRGKSGSLGKVWYYAFGFRLALVHQ